MNPSFLLATIVAAFAGIAQAGNIYIYSPYSASVCSPGNICPIAWHVGNEGPQFDRIDIELLSGDPQNAKVVAPIVLGYDLSQGNTYMWNVPQGAFSEGSDYFIRIKAVGTDYQSYSHTFPVGFGPFPTVVPTIVPTGTATPTGTISPTRSASVRSSISSAKTVSTVTASSSSAMSVQGSLTVAVALTAAVFAFMMF